jgi:hypothetical protein
MNRLSKRSNRTVVLLQVRKSLAKKFKILTLRLLSIFSREPSISDIIGCRVLTDEGLHGCHRVV